MGHIPIMLIVESGVGSVLDPLLFLIYINDLERNIKPNIKFSSDDTMLFSVVKDPLISACESNHDLNIIHQQAHHTAVWNAVFTEI